MSINKKSLELHEKLHGILEINVKQHIESQEDMALMYSPGVAAPSFEIAKDESKVYDYTIKKNTVLVVSDGSAVLGLGNIKAKAAIPVMEGKAALFKEFANIDAFPICLDTQDVDEIVTTIKNIAPIAGGINLEDFSAPRCFEIEKRLIDELDIPVMHDDQHGTAIVCAAALENALKVVNKDKDVNILINGLGSAGIAITKLLIQLNYHNFTLCDKNGLVFQGRLTNEDLDVLTSYLTKKKEDKSELKLKDVIHNQDVFIGVSVANILNEEMIEKMADKPIVFAMANPSPEIDPTLAKKTKIAVLATGRSDYPNQVNNVLVFPGIFRGVLNKRASKISEEMKLVVVKTLANLVSDENLTAEYILPNALDKRVVAQISEAIEKL